MVKSWGQKLRDEGLAMGVSVSGPREREALVLRLLQRRFEPLPSATVARIHRATDADLARVVDDIFQASALDEILPG